MEDVLDDEDNEIIIIEDPKPKPKIPVIVLCDSDIDDEEDSTDVVSLDHSITPTEDNDNEEDSTEIKSIDDGITPISDDDEDSTDVESLDDGITPISDDDEDSTEAVSLDDGITPVIDILSDPEEMDISEDMSSINNPILNNNTSSSSVLPDYIPLEIPKSYDTGVPSNSFTNNDIKNEKRLTKDFSKRLKTQESASSLKSSFACPECRAELSSVKMLERHVQSRHPRSQHSHQHNNIKALLGTTLQQRLKLNPLKNPIFTSTATCTTSANVSNTSNDNQATCRITALPPLVNRITANHDNKVRTASNTCTSSGKPSTSDRNNKNCRPLTVVIYSPNSERQDRFVQVSPLSTDKQQNNRKIIDNTDNQNRKKDVIDLELFDSPFQDPSEVMTSNGTRNRDNAKKCYGPSSSKRKRKHHLGQRTGDNNDKDLMNRPAKSRNKDVDKRRRTARTYSHDKVPYKNEPSLPSMDKLKLMKHIIMIDLDNWQKIFESDLIFHPATFVWGFQGGSTSWKPPASSSLLKNLREVNCFYLHPRCGRSKDAADFALCVQAGKLDVLLPKQIIFTVLSGDTGFNELQNQLSLSKREVHIVNPHNKSIDTVLTILNSIAEK